LPVGLSRQHAVDRIQERSRASSAVGSIYKHNFAAFAPVRNASSAGAGGREQASSIMAALFFTWFSPRVDTTNTTHLFGMSHPIGTTDAADDPQSGPSRDRKLGSQDEQNSRDRGSGPARYPPMFRRDRRPMFEALEDRKMLAAGYHHGYVIINGTKGNDDIQVQSIPQQPTQNNPNPAPLLQVEINGQTTTFSQSVIKGIVINGKRGDDHITVDASVTNLVGILAGAGNDTVQGGGGTNYIYGERGSDTITGGAGVDVITGDTGNDVINGGAGNDIIDGGIGDDTIHGDGGDDQLAGGVGADTLNGDDGQDQLRGDAGIDAIYGGDGNDVLDGGAGNDNLHGGADKDGLFGAAGNDSLFGDDGADHLDGGAGDDTCLGGDGNDQLKGGLGVDHLDGEAGDNLLDNDGQNDVILNGITADLDLEFRVGPPDANGFSMAQLDLQNVNGELVTKFTIRTSDQNIQQVDIVVDKLAYNLIPVSSQQADTVVTFSTDPVGNELPFPLGAPVPHVGSKIGVSTNSDLTGGTAVRTFVI
jgi:Ca2+-binding RTX toxin-like protein